VPTTVAIEAGATETLRIRNPWPGQRVEVMDARGKTVTSSEDPTLRVSVRKGESYLLARADMAKTPQTFATITGQPALHSRKLGSVQIGK
jgi:hypothetical protein